MKHLIYLCSSFLLLTGCLDRSGDYGGYITQLKDGTSTQHPVSITVGKAQGSTIDCDVTETGSPKFLNSNFSIRLAGKKAYVSGLSKSANDLELVKDKNSQCWRSAAPKVFACLDATGFQFQVEVSDTLQLHFWTNKGASIPRSPVSTDRHTFTVSQLREMSTRGNFDNRIEYETLIQAKKQAEIAVQSLAPRLSINGVSNYFTGGPIGLVQSLSELAPFLFPSNWFAAKSQERTAKAAETAQHLLKVDIALQVESLASQIARDSSILDAYSGLVDETAPIREQISVRERLGQYPEGSTNNIDSILNEARQDSIALQETLREEKRNLAIMVGLSDLNSISTVDWSKEPNPLSNPLPVVTKTMIERAVSKSLEILQIQSLIEAAQMKTKQAVWSWLDPNGGTATGIGTANGANVALSKAALESLQIQSEQIYNLIQQKAWNAAQQLQTSQQAYGLATSTLAINDARKTQIFDKVKLGLTIDFFGLVQILQDDLKTQIDVQNSIANYRSSKAAVNRLLLQGAYDKIK